MTTSNKYWLYLEQLRRSGVVNMFGAAKYLEKEFGISNRQARKILGDWMDKYNPADYEPEKAE